MIENKTETNDEMESMAEGSKGRGGESETETHTCTQGYAVGPSQPQCLYLTIFMVPQGS